MKNKDIVFVNNESYGNEPEKQMLVIIDSKCFLVSIEDYKKVIDLINHQRIKDDYLISECTNLLYDFLRKYTIIQDSIPTLMF